MLLTIILLSYSPPDDALLPPKLGRFVDEDDCLPLLIGRVDDDGGLLSTAAADCSDDDCCVLPSAGAPSVTTVTAPSSAAASSTPGLQEHLLLSCHCSLP
jgi:hypothetical protein